MPAILSTFDDVSASVAAVNAVLAPIAAPVPNASQTTPTKAALSHAIEVTPYGSPPSSQPFVATPATDPVAYLMPPPPPVQSPVAQAFDAQAAVLEVAAVASPPPVHLTISTSATATASASTTSSPFCLDRAIQEMKAHPKSDTVVYAQKTSSNSDSYALRKRKIVHEFLEGLASAAPRYNHMLKKTLNVPSYFPPGEHAVVFVALSGEDNKRKKVLILNDMLIDWIGNKKKNDGGYPSPGTINSGMRAFFAFTKDTFNWHFSSSDFKFDGGFNGFFKSLCKSRQKEDVSITQFFHFLFKQQSTLTFPSPFILNQHLHHSPVTVLKGRDAH